MPSSVQSLSRVRLLATPWTAAHQTSLSITNSRSPFKPMSIGLVMPSNHLILCHPLLLQPSIFPSPRPRDMQCVTVSIWCGLIALMAQTLTLSFIMAIATCPFMPFSLTKEAVSFSSPWIWAHLWDSSGATESGGSHNIPLRARLQEACVFPLAPWLFHLPWEKMSVSSFLRTRQVWSRTRFPWSSCKGHPRPDDPQLFIR